MTKRSRLGIGSSIFFAYMEWWNKNLFNNRRSDAEFVGMPVPGFRGGGVGLVMWDRS